MPRTVLVLATDLMLPLTSVSRTFGILAARGAGKSNTAAVMAEEMFAAKLPFVVIDPVGAWYGLRSSADGKKPGLPIPIFGGKHGDVPIERDSGELIADLIVEKRLTCVIDLSQFESETSKKKFLLAFAKRLYQKNDSPLHLFLEEADDYIPQKPMGNDENYLLRAWENIVRRGRGRGLGMTMITQRSASINKNVLTQVETLIAMRTTGPQDVAAIKEWIKYNQASPDVLATLSSLADGQAWVWSPHFLKTMSRYQIRRRSTFDSGATPTNVRAQDTRPPATLADVDLVALRAKMAATVEKAKADDPVLLRKRIIELQKELKLKGIHGVSKDAVEQIRQQEWSAGVQRGKADAQKDIAASYRAGADDMARRAILVFDELEQYMKDAHAIVITKDMDRGRFDIRQQVKSVRPQSIDAKSIEVHRGNMDTPRTIIGVDRAVGRDRSVIVHARKEGSGAIMIDAVHEGVSGPEQRILDAIAWQESLGVPQPAVTAVAMLSKYSHTSGGFNNLKSKLRSKGLIEYPSAGALALTDAGRALANKPDGNVSDDEMQRRVYETLSEPEKRVLSPLIASWPETLTTAQVAEAAKYEPTSGGFNNLKSRLRTLGLIEYPKSGILKASDLLFPISSR